MTTAAHHGPALAIIGTCKGCCHLRIEEVRRTARRRERTILCAHPAFPDGMGLAPVGGSPFATPERCPEMGAARLALARSVVAEDGAAIHRRMENAPIVDSAETAGRVPPRARSWVHVNAGEALAEGVKDPNAGWIWRSPVGLYFVWVQARPRHEPMYYAAARVGVGGEIDCYTRSFEAPPRPTWVAPKSAWLCDRGTFAEAKAACMDDAKRRADSAARGAGEESE